MSEGNNLGVGKLMEQLLLNQATGTKTSLENLGVVARLEKILFDKTRGKNGEAFNTQWAKDKAALSDGLKSVSQVFPHFSLHDESHCKTILNNIVSLCGEEVIYNLSAADIWLLLSAVYFHDSGMIKTIRESRIPKFSYRGTSRL